MNSSSKIRVLLLDDHEISGEVGGGQFARLSLYGRLDRSRFEPVLLTSIDGRLAEMAKARGIRVEIEPINLGFDWFDRESIAAYPSQLPRLAKHVLGASLRLKEVIRRLQPAILHPNENLSRLVASAASPFVECSCVTHVDNLFSDTWVDRFVCELWAHSFDHLVPVSQEAAAPFERTFARTDDRMTVIPEAIEPEDFLGLDSGYVRDEFSVPPESILISSVGRLVELKRQDWLIRAVAALDETLRSEVCVLLVGDGPNLQSLRKLADSLGVSESIRFTGHRDDVPAILSETDLSVLCSRTEACPRVVIESLAAGCSVIATDVGNVRHMLADGRFGRIVTSGQPAEFIEVFRETVRRLASTGHEPLHDVEKQRQHVREHFSWERCVQATQEVFERVNA